MMFRKRILGSLIVALLSLVLVTTTALAQEGPSDTPTDDAVNAIAKKLYCPVCPNTPLDVCETQACKDWRAQIRDQLSSGWNEQQILDFFVTRYGERVLAEPQRSGFTSLVWMLPVVAVLLGLGIVGQILRGWRAQREEPAQPASSPPPVDPNVLARLEKELEEMD